MAVTHPYVAIDAAYSHAVEAAVTDHEQAVSAANTQLAADLASASDEAEKATLLDAFDAVVSPFRAAYEAAIVQAEQDREAAKTTGAAGHQAFEAELAAKEANRVTLRDKANTALATNAAYLAQPVIPPSPTNAQLIAAVRVIRAQTDALTKQNNALIKLMLGLLEDVNGT